MSRLVGCSSLVRWFALIMLFSPLLTVSAAKDAGCFKKEGGNVVYKGSCTDSEYKLQLSKEQFSIDFGYAGTKIGKYVKYEMSVAGCTLKFSITDYNTGDGTVPKFEIEKVTPLEFPATLSVDSSSKFAIQGKGSPVSLGQVCTNSPVFDDKGDGKFETTVSIKLTKDGPLPDFSLTIKGPMTNADDGDVSESGGLLLLWIGLGVGIPLIISAIVVAVVCIVKRYRKKKKAKAEADAKNNIEVLEPGNVSRMGMTHKSKVASVVGNLNDKSNMQTTTQEDEKTENVTLREPSKYANFLLFQPEVMANASRARIEELVRQIEWTSDQLLHFRMLLGAEEAILRFKKEENRTDRVGLEKIKRQQRIVDNYNYADSLGTPIASKTYDKEMEMEAKKKKEQEEAQKKKKEQEEAKKRVNP